MFNQEEDYFFTNHARYKKSNRNISDISIKLCLLYGQKIHKTKISFFFISKKILKNNNINPNMEGLCVLVSKDNSIITVYKNKKAISNIKKLSKRSLKCK